MWAKLKCPQKKLFLIKCIHTLIWFIFVIMIMYILWSGITGNSSRTSWLAVGAVSAECLVLALFRGRCPLTLIARKFSVSTKENFDIFLPEWLARHNKLIFGLLFFTGIILMLIRL